MNENLIEQLMDAGYDFSSINLILKMLDSEGNKTNSIEEHNAIFNIEPHVTSSEIKNFMNYCMINSLLPSECFMEVEYMNKEYPTEYIFNFKHSEDFIDILMDDLDDRKDIKMLLKLDKDVKTNFIYKIRELRDEYNFFDDFDLDYLNKLQNILSNNDSDELAILEIKNENTEELYFVLDHVNDSKSKFEIDEEIKKYRVIYNLHKEYPGIEDFELPVYSLYILKQLYEKINNENFKNLISFIDYSGQIEKESLLYLLNFNSKENPEAINILDNYTCREQTILLDAYANTSSNVYKLIKELVDNEVIINNHTDIKVNSIIKDKLGPEINDELLDLFIQEIKFNKDLEFEDLLQIKYGYEESINVSEYISNEEGFYKSHEKELLRNILLYNARLDNIDDLIDVEKFKNTDFYYCASDVDLLSALLNTNFNIEYVTEFSYDFLCVLADELPEYKLTKEECKEIQNFINYDFDEMDFRVALRGLCSRKFMVIDQVDFYKKGLEFYNTLEEMKKDEFCNSKIEELNDKNINYIFPMLQRYREEDEFGKQILKTFIDKQIYNGNINLLKVLDKPLAEEILDDIKNDNYIIKGLAIKIDKDTYDYIKESFEKIDNNKKFLWTDSYKQTFIRLINSKKSRDILNYYLDNLDTPKECFEKRNLSVDNLKLIKLCFHFDDYKSEFRKKHHDIDSVLHYAFYDIKNNLYKKIDANYESKELLEYARNEFERIENEICELHPDAVEDIKAEFSIIKTEMQNINKQPEIER